MQARGRGMTSEAFQQGAAGVAMQGARPEKAERLSKGVPQQGTEGGLSGPGRRSPGATAETYRDATAAKPQEDWLPEHTAWSPHSPQVSPTCWQAQVPHHRGTEGAVASSAPSLHALPVLGVP